MMAKYLVILAATSTPSIVKTKMNQMPSLGRHVVVVVDINSPNVGTPRLRVEQIFNVTIRTKVLM